jgi:hypothetical protein
MAMEIDEVSGLTANEKYENFLKILQTTQYLDDGGRITEDWMEEHKALILQYREWIDNFADVNDEIEDPAFRKQCGETEILIRQLCNSIRTSQTFDVKIYHMFMRHMKFIIETVNTDEEMSDLLSMLNM